MVEQVEAYKKTTKTGKVVSVREYQREGNALAAEHALAIPGRPPMAAVPGQFPGGRSIPGLFLPPTTLIPPPDPMASPQIKGDPLREKADGKDKAHGLKISEKSAKVVHKAEKILKPKVSGGKK